VRAMTAKEVEQLATDRIVGLDTEVVELAVLLHQEQVSRLEHVACSRGVSLGQLIRHLIDDFLTWHGRGDPGDPAGAQHRPRVSAKPGNPE